MSARKRNLSILGVVALALVLALLIDVPGTPLSHRNAFTPTAPRDASSRSGFGSAPTSPPQSAKSTTDPRSPAARFRSNDGPSTKLK